MSLHDFHRSLQAFYRSLQVSFRSCQVSEGLLYASAGSYLGLYMLLHILVGLLQVLCKPYACLFPVSAAMLQVSAGISKDLLLALKVCFMFLQACSRSCSHLEYD